MLPLRVRTEHVHHARPAFPGTAVVLGPETYEVISETELPEEGLVRYELRTWPEGEVERGRVVYGRDFVHRVGQERARARLRARVHPWRAFLYPFIGLLPEEPQERACLALGLDPRSATAASGLVESLVVLAAIALAARHADTGAAVLIVVLAPGLVFVVLPGLGRAAAAVLFGETAGSAAVVAGVSLLRGVGAVHVRPPRGFAPLTRARFWERLAQGDEVLPQADGTVLVRGLLPHVGWDRRRRLEIGGQYWGIEPCAPELASGRLVHAYRLLPLEEPAAPEMPRPRPPERGTYADEVKGGIRCEWDAFNSGLAWATTLLGAGVQARAFDHRGGAPATRRSVLATATASALLAIYLLHFLPGPPGDPTVPVIVLLAALLLLDAALRARAVARGRYAPSLFRFLVPSHLLPPERLAYRAHREAEREALGQLV